MNQFKYQLLSMMISDEASQDITRRCLPSLKIICIFIRIRFKNDKFVLSANKSFRLHFEYTEHRSRDSRQQSVFNRHKQTSKLSVAHVSRSNTLPVMVCPDVRAARTANRATYRLRERHASSLGFAGRPCRAGLS